MKKTILIFCLALIVLSVLAMPAFVRAGDDDQPAETRLPNPLQTDDPREIIGLAVNLILSVLGTVALVMFIYGGFLWLTSGGVQEKITKGRDILVWSAIGIVLILSSYLILNQVFQIFK